MFANYPFGNLPFGGNQLLQSSILFYGVADFKVSTDYFIYVATDEFRTETEDNPPDQPFSGALDQPLQFRRSIINSEGFGGIVQASGEMVISNANSEYDFLPESYTVDGRDQTVRMGYEGLPFKDWLTIFTGTATDAHVDEQEFRIGLKDYAYKLDVPLQTKSYAGTGSVEGGVDLKGKKKPRAFGYADNLTPVLVSAQYQLYQVNDGPIEAVSAVYTNGVALGYDGDFPTSAALLAANITDGRYATCLSEGLFRIDFLLDGNIVTCDVQGDKTGGTFVSKIGAIIRRIVSTSTVIADPDGLYLPAFTRFDAEQPYDVGYYADHNSSVSVSEVLQTLAGFGSFVGFRRNGKLEIVRFTEPEGTPSMRFNETDIIDIKRERLSDGLAPPPWRWRVGYARNWTVQTSDIAGSVSNVRRDYLGEEIRYAVAESYPVKGNFPFAQERDVGGYLRNEADALSEAERLLDLYRKPASLYRLTLNERVFGLELGDVVHVTFSRFDLKAGKLLRVVEIGENATELSNEIVGFG